MLEVHQRLDYQTSTTSLRLSRNNNNSPTLKGHLSSKHKVSSTRPREGINRRTICLWKLSSRDDDRRCSNSLHNRRPLLHPERVALQLTWDNQCLRAHSRCLLRQLATPGLLHLLLPLARRLRRALPRQQVVSSKICLLHKSRVHARLVRILPAQVCKVCLHRLLEPWGRLHNCHHDRWEVLCKRHHSDPQHLRRPCSSLHRCTEVCSKHRQCLYCLTSRHSISRNHRCNKALLLAQDTPPTSRPRILASSQHRVEDTHQHRQHLKPPWLRDTRPHRPENWGIRAVSLPRPTWPHWETWDTRVVNPPRAVCRAPCSDNRRTRSHLERAAHLLATLTSRIHHCHRKQRRGCHRLRLN